MQIFLEGDLSLSSKACYTYNVKEITYCWKRSRSIWSFSFKISWWKDDIKRELFYGEIWVILESMSKTPSFVPCKLHWRLLIPLSVCWVIVVFLPSSLIRFFMIKFPSESPAAIMKGFRDLFTAKEVTKSVCFYTVELSLKFGFQILTVKSKEEVRYKFYYPLLIGIESIWVIGPKWRLL